jgi:hypothetical protein
MAITRSQIARQLYRDAGYVEKAYGKAAATPGPVERPTITPSNNTSDGNNNLDKVANVVSTTSDLKRYKTLIEGGGFKSLIPDPVSLGGMLLINKIMNSRKKKDVSNVPTLNFGDENNENNLEENNPEGVFIGNNPEDVFIGTGLAEEAKQNIIKNQEKQEEGISDAEAELRAQGLLANGGRAGLAEGGMPYEGGIMDLDSARQMYGLGKLVKKITRSVKKVAKSPIGKAALLGVGAYGLGGGTFFGKMLPGVTRGGQGFGGFGGLSSIFGNVGDIIGGTGLGDKFAKAAGSKIGLGITAASAIAGMLTPEQEEEAQTIADETGIDIAEIRANPDKYLARRFRAEGGSIDEPVAKKTMPLLDMDGQEMDLRAEGGFVPLGRMEKADDVPARLSKNEFVFTAEAVRNAGEGDVDKGAEVMYNMMKNLESGGEVSEESQGLEGAREMFQTSQRLEEVI